MFGETVLARVAVAIGPYSAGHVMFLVCLVLAYPLGFCFRALPVASAWRHVLSIVGGMCLGLMCYGVVFAHLLIPSLATYVFVRFVKSPKVPVIVLACTMLHLAAHHAHLMMLGGSHREQTLDYTAPLMVLVIKLSTFSYNVADGRALAKNKDLPLPSYLRQRALTSVPSLLEFLAFVLFPGSVFAGPGHEFAEYKQAADEVPLLYPAPHRHMRDLRPSTIVPALCKFLVAGACMPGVVLSSRINMNFAATDAFRYQLDFAQRFWYVQLSATARRFQYYLVWKLSEGACVAAGLGYRGRLSDGTDDWSGVENVDIAGIEFAPNFKALLDVWNKGANNWLRYYVYLRLSPPPSKPTALTTLLTFMLSAVWHGFYFGYYLTFIAGAFCTLLARLARQRLRPWAIRLDSISKVGFSMKMAYDALGWLATITLLNYIVVPFILLDAQKTWAVYKSLYFCGHIAAAMAFIVLRHIFNRRFCIASV